MKNGSTKRTHRLGLIWLAMIAISLTALLPVGVSFAQPVTWTGLGADNNWSTTANWSTNTVPLSTDAVVFDGTSTKDATIDVSVTVAGVQINSGYTGTITQNATFTVGASGFTQNGGTFTGGAFNMTVNGNVALDGGTFTAPSGTMTVNTGNFTSTGGIFDHNSGTVNFIGNPGRLSQSSLVKEVLRGGRVI